MIFAIILRILYKKKYELKRNMNDFFEDYKLSESYIGDVKYNLFKPQSLSMELMSHYAIAYEETQTYLICKFSKEIPNVTLKVYAYTTYKQLIDIIFVEQTGKFDHTSKITLPQETAYVNIEVLETNENKVPDIIEHKYFINKVIAKLATVSLFHLLIGISYLTMYLIDDDMIDSFLTTENNSILLSVLIVVCLINYLLVNKTLKKRAKVGMKK